MNKYILTGFICLLVFNCGSKKRVITKKEKNPPVIITKKAEDKEGNTQLQKVSENFKSTTKTYIDTYKLIAQEEMRLYKIPASITIAQGILESGSGKGRLSIEANNHFGIKCHNWTGAKIYHDDDEDQECFRKYNNAKYSFRDHSLFLTGRKRYEALFKLKQNDYKGWAKGLQQAGYATDTKYPEKLISLIERYELYKLDRNQNINDDIVKTSSVVPKKIIHVVVSGDTLYYISKMHGISVDDLKKLNNLKNNTIAIGQELQVNKN